MSEIIFTPISGDDFTINAVPGTINCGDGHDDKGGGLYPNTRAGEARNGSCSVIIDDAGFTIENARALNSAGGVGSYTITGAGLKANQYSYEALVDVTIQGDSVMTANITWKGTVE